MRAFRNLFLLFIGLALAGNLAAQQHDPPLVVEITHPTSLSGSYIHGFQGSGWGVSATLPAPAIGQMEWAYDITPDSLVCDTITNDYTGKVVMVRRGACQFGDKAFYAQQSGAVACVICNNATGVINLAGGTLGPQVTIPVVMLDDADCALIDAAIANGDSVSMTIRQPNIFSGVSKYAYETPQSHIQPLQDMEITIVNGTGSTASNVTVNAEVTDPSGTVTTLTETVPTVAADSIVTVTFATPYTPVDTGDYSVAFSSSITADTVLDAFRIGDSKWTNDVQANYAWVGVTDQGFTDAGYRFDMGNAYLAGPNGGIVRQASFALNNANAYIGETFNILLYEIDPAAGGTITDYNQFSTPVAAASHTITAADTAAADIELFETLFDINSGADSFLMKRDTQYLLVVNYQGNAASPILPSPRFTTAGDGDYLSISTTVFTDQLYLGGFQGGPKAFIRLHIGEAATTNVSAEKIDQDNFAVFPNPTTDQINVELTLEEISSNVNVDLIDIRGTLLEERVYSNVQNETYQFNTNELPAGTYFIRVRTDNGYNIKQFTKH
jgi:hypothetical protein